MKNIAAVIFGILVALVLIEAILRLGGSVFFAWQDYKNEMSLKKRGSLRIMCLGESTTALGGRFSYPSQLETILNEKKVGVNFSVINKGLPGLGTFDIVAHLSNNLDQFKPDVVVVMMGINDKIDGVSWHLEPNKLEIIIKSLRVYKLAKLLNQHISAKFEKDESETDFIEETKRISLCQRVKNRLQDYQSDEEREILYHELNACYLQEKECDQVKRIVEDGLSNSSLKGEMYYSLGWCYGSRHEFEKSRDMFQKANTMDRSLYHQYYVSLGWSYAKLGDYQKAEKMFIKALKVNPGYTRAYYELGMCYFEQRKYDQAVKALEKGLVNNPKINFDQYLSLADAYLELGEYGKSEIMYKKASELEIGNIKPYQGLIKLYKSLNNSSLVKKYSDTVNKMEKDVYNPITRENYQRLKEIVLQRKIKLVVVQYPMLRIDSLRKMLNDDENIIFVDNHDFFKKAVEDEGYDMYFKDQFAGDFGHCTPKGNYLLASNIVEVILTKIFP